MLLLTKAYNKKIMSNVRAKVQLNAETLTNHPNKRKVMSDAVFVCVNIYCNVCLSAAAATTTAVCGEALLLSVYLKKLTNHC